LKRPRIHTTNAASLGCFDLKTKTFSYDVTADISDRFEILGTYKGIPVSVAIGDNQASVFSTLADERDVLLNVGTGSQVSVVSDVIKTGENIEARPYFDSKYLLVGAALCGGRAYGMLKDFYAEFLKAAGISEMTDATGMSRTADIYSVMNKLMADHTESVQDILKVDTRFAGTRKQPELCGSIRGITVNNFTPANLTYGFLDGMMEELYVMFEQMDERRINLVGSGNGIRKNEVLVKIAENKFGGYLRIPAHTEEAAYGAALFGLVACGVFESAKQAQALIKYEGVR